MHSTWLYSDVTLHGESTYHGPIAVSVATIKIHNLTDSLINNYQKQKE